MLGTMLGAADVTVKKNDLCPSNTFQTPKFLYYKEFFLVINDSTDIFFSVQLTQNFYFYKLNPRGTPSDHPLQHSCK